MKKTKVPKKISNFNFNFFKSNNFFYLNLIFLNRLFFKFSSIANLFHSNFLKIHFSSQ